MSPDASPDEARAGAPSRPFNTDQLVAFMAVLAYAVTEIVMFMGYVPWRDEAQAWHVARSLAQPLDFLVIPGEGHPPLWFWIVRGLSSFASFDQARLLTLAASLVNAVLCWKLLRDRLLLLILLLFSGALTMQWGYQFRPYTLVLTTILVALLLDRNGRVIAGTWVLAIGCALHFYAGFVFAFWLLVQWRRGASVTGLLGPSLVAALFGVSALLSSMGNPGGSPNPSNLLTGMIRSLSWWLPGQMFRHHPLSAIAYLALLAVGLWRSPFILGALVALTLLFSAATAVIYGAYLWHTTFLMMLAVMAFLMAGTRANWWVLAILLAPQAIQGIANVRTALTTEANGDIAIYRMVQDDAGLSTIPEEQLVAWPDYMLASASASQDFTYRSGNNGTTIGPVDWRNRSSDMIDPGLATLQTPYWVVCKGCQPLVNFLLQADLKVDIVGTTRNYSDGTLYAPRISR